MLTEKKKQINKEVTAPPVTFDDIELADEDLCFIKAMLNVFSMVDGYKHLDELNPGTVGSLCSEALDKIEGLQKFVESVYRAAPRPAKVV